MNLLCVDSGKERYCSKPIVKTRTQCKTEYSFSSKPLPKKLAIGSAFSDMKRTPIISASISLPRRAQNSFLSVQALLSIALSIWKSSTQTSLPLQRLHGLPQYTPTSPCKLFHSFSPPPACQGTS